MSLLSATSICLDVGTQMKLAVEVYRAGSYFYLVLSTFGMALTAVGPGYRQEIVKLALAREYDVDSKTIFNQVAVPILGFCRFRRLLSSPRTPGRPRSSCTGSGCG